MEPQRAGARPNRMLADTSAIHAFGAAQARHAAELQTVSATLASVQALLASDALGPVGASFVAALSNAIAQESELAAGLEAGAAAAAATVHATADAYVDTERGTGTAIARLGT